MKKVLLALVLLGGIAKAQTTHPAGVSGCIARWDFTSTGSTPTTIPDVSGNGHPATPHFLIPAHGFRNFPNTAMDFNGSTSIASVPTSTQLNPAQISIVALVKFDSFYSGNCQTNAIICKTRNFFQPGAWGMLVDDQTHDLDCNVFSPNFETLDFLYPSTSVTVQTAGVVNPDKWYLFVEAYNGDTLRQYQVPMDTNAFVSSITYLTKQKIGYPLGMNTASVTIGGMRNGAYPYNFGGQMDEVALFDHAISTEDVTMIYRYLWNGAGVGVAGSKPLEATIAYDGKNVLVDNPIPGKKIGISVYDLTGKRIAEQSSVASRASVDVSALAPQLLVVRIEQEGKLEVKKIGNF